jgi:hypothetical protein
MAQAGLNRFLLTAFRFGSSRQNNEKARRNAGFFALPGT